MTVIPFLCHVNSQCDTSWCSVVEWQHQSGGNVLSNASKCWQSWQIKGSFSVLQSLFGPSMEKQHPHWAQYGWIKAWDLQSSKVGKLGMHTGTGYEPGDQGHPLPAWCIDIWYAQNDTHIPIVKGMFTMMLYSYHLSNGSVSMTQTSPVVACVSRYCYRYKNVVSISISI